MTTSSPRVASRRADPVAPGLVSAARPLGTPVALGLLGTLVALAGSWNVSLWTDEAATISAARRSTAGLWRLVHHIDAVHAAYYFLIHFWGGAFGWSAVSLRLPSAIATGLAVVGVWALARALGRADAAVVAAVIAIVLPRMTWMGIEARSFGPSAAVAVWATVAFCIALRSRRRWWTAYGVLVALGTALNIYLALLVLAHAVTILALERRRIRAAWPWLAAAAAGTLAASPVVLESLGQRGQLGDNAVSAATLARQAVVNEFFLGQTPTRVSATNDGHALWSLAGLALAVVGWALVAAAVVALARRGDRTTLWLVLPWLLLPTVVVGLYSLAVSPLYNPRYFTFCAPAAALLIGFGVRSLARRPLRVAAVILVVVLAVPVYLSQRESTGKSGTDWSQTAAYVDAHAHQGDGVYFAPLDETTAPVVERTTRNIEVSYPDAFRGLRDLTLTTSPLADDSLRGESSQLSDSAVPLAGVDTIWVVRPTDYSAASTARDTAVLERAGFRERSRWTGPMDTVVAFSR
ncbi:glycosyltransferase family 39 protein [Frondihabitans peucedani]|uniref:glycosyltransferase family 39 protein n=1 Tax=Frondihabitans peucedani TaxID=598626 RepID=UPI0031E1A8CA